MEMQNFGLLRKAAGRAVLQPIPVPQIRDNYIIVRTVAIALNPTDWTALDAVGNSGTIVGIDYAGIVEEVGKGVKKSFRKGDRICGTSHGANDADPETGAFARYIITKGDLQMHIPDSMSFEAACTLGCGVFSAGSALYRCLELPLLSSNQNDNHDPILIYGGSTATGSLAIQLARLSGRKVVTTCSPKHFELMKSRGADLVYDYNVPCIGEQIRVATNGSITTVLDNVSVGSSAAICAESIGPNGGIYCNLIGIDCPRRDVKSISFLGYSVSGESYVFEGKEYDADPEYFEFGVQLIEIVDPLLAAGMLRPHPQRVERGGLLGALVGMEEMRMGKVSGEKLVYLVEETEWL